MKKRIILFLTFLLTTMFLTGCSVSTSYERIEQLNEIADKVAENGAGYKLPEGYSIKYPDTKDTGIIELTRREEGENTIRAKYKIANSTAEIINVVIVTDKYVDDFFDIIYIVVIIALIIYIIDVFYSK